MESNLMPSLLQGFTTKESRSVSWLEVMECLTDGGLKELTERYRSTGDRQWKSRLPCITPACQLNGTGKEMADVVGMTGLVFVDLDGIPESEIDTVRRKINSDPHTFLSKLSVSGRGFHVLAPFEGDDYAQAFLTVNCHYADLTGFAFDEKCSNTNRLMALNHDEKAYFNPKADTLTPALSLKGEGDFSLASDNGHEYQADWNTPSPSRERAGVRVGLAVNIVERHGESYYEGNRHSYLLKCLCMMNRLGVSFQEAEAWALTHDLGEGEIRRLAKSVYTLYSHQHGTFDMPKERRSLSQCHNVTAALQAHTRAYSVAESKCLSENPELYVGQFLPFPEYQWPRFIQQMVDCGDSKPQRDVILLSAFCVLGAMLGRLVRFKYSHRYWHPAMQVFIVAPPASGKGVVSMVRHLAEPLHDKMMGSYEAAKKRYEKEKAVYDNAGRERASMEIPQAPVQKMFLIAGNNSSTGILENLADADGWALICESEADTLSAAINTDYGNWDDTLRRAHDHDRLSYNRRTNKEYRQIQNPCMGVLICGTPAQVKPLIPSAENGLFSRQLFATLPSIDEFVDQFGDEDVDMDSLFYGWGKEWLGRLEQMQCTMSSIELRLTEAQRQRFTSHFARMFNHARATQPGHHMKSSVAREAINILRIMSVVALLRQHDTGAGLTVATDIPHENVQDGVAMRYDLGVTDADFDAVLSLAEPIYRNACDILTLLPSTEAVRNSISPTDHLLCKLPLEFSTSQAMEIGEQLGITRTNVATILGRLCATGRLVNVARGRYEFSSLARSRARVL